MSLAALKLQLAAVVSGLTRQSPALRTGLSDLDDLLPDQGLATGRLTELLIPPGHGKTTLTRALVSTTLAAGRSVAWIDATRTLDPRDWADIAGEALWVVRPPDATKGAWCADLLLRSGGFALVILDGAPALSRALCVRLTQLARDSDAAFLVLNDGRIAADSGGAIRLRGTAPHAPHRGLTLTLERGGPYRRTTLDLPVSYDERHTTHRLHAHPEVPDRRDRARERGLSRGQSPSEPSAAAAGDVVDRPAARPAWRRTRAGQRAARTGDGVAS